MKYMMLIYGDEHALSEAEREHCYVESTKLIHQIKASGKFVSSAPLHPTSTATSVRVREGKHLITDGPFAETREQLGGYYLIDADDLDDAISIAVRVPPVKWGTVEIRPVVELPGMPES